MGLTGIGLARIKMVVGAFCDRRSRAKIRDKLRMEYSVQNQDVLIHEVRPKWDDPEKTTESSVARLRYGNGISGRGKGAPGALSSTRQVTFGPMSIHQSRCSGFT